MNSLAATGLNQYLTYTLEEETFGLDIARVLEVLDTAVITKIPGMPQFMRGVINRRGAAVPVVDLRLRLGMPAADRTCDSSIIITEIDVAGDRIVLGALADSVQEVLDIDPSRIEPAPAIGGTATADFVTGIARQGDRFILLLDMDRVFSGNQLTHLRFPQTSPAL